ncbi:hypothetical protein ROBYS_24020 [Roseobacter sp. OBYS 0001]|nr:hypothetical protein ROBYS_24020 [Roseobacter sp. OBYS 0001]
MKDLRSDSLVLNEREADLAAENRLLQKKHDRGWGVRRLRYTASEKLKIVRTVEGSHFPVKQTLGMLGIQCSTFYRLGKQILPTSKSLAGAGVTQPSTYRVTTNAKEGQRSYREVR